jgi:hypothetical protein
MVIYDDFFGWMLIYDAEISGIWRISARFWDFNGGNEPEKKEGRAQPASIFNEKKIFPLPNMCWGFHVWFLV